MQSIAHGWSLGFQPIHLRALLSIWTSCLWVLLSSVSASAQSLSLTPGSFQRITHNMGKTGDLIIDLRVEPMLEYGGYSRCSYRISHAKFGKFPSGGKVEFSFEAYGYNAGRVLFEHRHQVDIEPGSGFIDGSFLVNFASSPELIQFNTSLNGSHLGGNSTTISAFRYFSGRGGEEELVIISDKSHTLSQDRKNAYSSLTKSNTWCYLTPNNFQGTYGLADRLPENWLELSSFDSISIDAIDLIAINEKRWRAIVNYVQAGGRLFIQRASNPQAIWERISRSAKKRLDGHDPLVNPGVQMGNTPASYLEPGRLTLQFSQGFDLLDNTEWDEYIRRSLENDWINVPSATMMGGTEDFSVETEFDSFLEGDDYLIPMVSGIARNYADYELFNFYAWVHQFQQILLYEALKPAMGDKDFSWLTSLQDASGRIVVHDGFGHFCIQRSLDIRDGWAGQQSLQGGVTNYAKRFKNGMGVEYWDWLLPSVGKTPAGVFIFFLVSFVGIACPAVLYWSNRTNRRIWLLLLTPAIALVAVFALFSYGMIKDGFQSISRIRSLTFLNENNEGMTWSRQTCFTASPPSEGVLLANDTLVMPLTHKQSFDRFRIRSEEAENGNRLSNLIEARKVSQYLLVHPVKTPPLLERLQIDDSAADSGLHIRNTGEFDWSVAVFMEPDGKCWLGERVLAGQSAQLVPIENQDAVERLEAKYRSVPLESPADAPSDSQRTLGSFFDFNWSYSTNVNSFTYPISEENVWKQAIQQITSERYYTQPTRQGSFWIFVEENPFVQRVLPDASESNSLHMISGHW